MKLIILYVISFCCIASSQSKTYYITPDLENYDNCTLNGTILSPCYTIHQLIDDEALSSNQQYLVLVFMPGKHVIPENRSLHLSKLELLPWNKQAEVMIECQFNADLAFNLRELKIMSLHFSYCSLSFFYGSLFGLHGASLYIKNSIFEGSQDDYAIKISFLVYKINFKMRNVTVLGCTFLSNYGAIKAYHFSIIPLEGIISHLLITNTKFQGNWRSDKSRGGAINVKNIRLKIHFSQFKNNTAIGGGAINALDSSLLLIGTTFVDNYAHGSGGSISLLNSDINVDHCHFINNFAGAHGTIVRWKTHQTQSLIFTSSIFQGNHVNDRGGAISIHNSGVSIDLSGITISNCQFNNNSAQLGGALYFQGREIIYIFNSIFIFNEAENGGTIYCDNNYHNININGGYSLSSSAENDGGFAYLLSSMLSVNDYVFISSSRASKGGAIYATNSCINIKNATTIGV